MNVLLALLALLLSRSIGAAETSAAQSEPAQPARATDKAAPVFLFCTGLVSMGLEVVWMRQFTPYLGNAVYSFALVLAVYLLATAMGSRDYRQWSQKHTPDQSRTVWSLLAAAAILPVVAVDPRLSLGWFVLPGIVRLVAIIPFCALAGFLTPLLIDSWSGGEPKRAGRAYAFNVAGCILGPLVASFCLLPHLSERWTVLCLSVPLFAIAGMMSLRGGTVDGTRATPVRFALCAAVGVLIVLLSRDYEAHYPDAVVLRDSTATVMAYGEGMGKGLLVNGIGMTALTPVTKYIAHLPMAAMERRPTNGLVICFGMGTSFRSMQSWGIPTAVVDLVPSVPKLFGYYHADADAILRSPHVRVFADDGRRFLDGSQEMYDVIVFDPPPPVSATGSSLLYSRELYVVVKRHLRKDGILQMWYPERDGEPVSTAAITKALVESFPYVRAYHSFDGTLGIHYLASMSPIPELKSDVLAARMPAAAVADLAEWGPNTGARQQLDMVLQRELDLKALMEKAPRVPAISDDAPINEYYFLRDRFGYYR